MLTLPARKEFLASLGKEAKPDPDPIDPSPLSASPHPDADSAARQAAAGPASSVPIHASTVASLEIFRGETLHVDPILIDGPISMERGPHRSALKAAVKVILNFHGNYASSCVTRIRDFPESSLDNGNRCARFRFDDAYTIRHAPEGTHHFYIEVNQENKICFISVRKENGEVICNYPPDSVPGAPCLPARIPALQRLLMMTIPASKEYLASLGGKVNPETDSDLTAGTKRKRGHTATASAPKRLEGTRGTPVAQSVSAANAEVDEATREAIMKTAWDNWRVEVATAKGGPAAERKEKMERARRNWLNAVLAVDSVPWKNLNIAGVSHDEKSNRIVAKTRRGEAKLNKPFSARQHQGSLTAAWLEAVITTEAWRDIHMPGRFGAGDWEPPCTITGVNTGSSTPCTWKATLKPPQEDELVEPCTFFLDVEGDKERRWDEALEARRAMEAGRYVPREEPKAAPLKKDRIQVSQTPLLHLAFWRQG